jgi:hypothetical protein
VANQLEELMTFDLNTDKRSIAWGSYEMSQDGDLVRHKLHSHNVMFEKAFWFRATPEELGLVGGSVKFPFYDLYEITHLEDTGLKSFDEVEKYLMGNLAKARVEHNLKCKSSVPSFLQRKKPPAQCGFNAPFMVCKAWPNNAWLYNKREDETFVYDRREPSCCKPWSFKKGEIWTTVGFYHPVTRALGPWYNAIPKLYPQHLHWVMTHRMKGDYVRKDHSYYNFVGYTPAGASGGPSRQLKIEEGDSITTVCADNPHCKTSMEKKLGKGAWKAFVARVDRMQWPDKKYADISNDITGEVLEAGQTDDTSMLQLSLGDVVNENRKQNAAITLAHAIRGHISTIEFWGVLTASFMAFALTFLAKRILRAQKAKTCPAVSCAVAPPCCPCLKTKQVQKKQ